MREILNDVEKWVNAGEAVAVATVVQTWGSAPRGVGSKMAFTLSHNISGSVSGGCVESATIEAGLQVLETGTPQLLHFGVADETAWEVGLACGGTIEVFVEKLDPALLRCWRDWVKHEHAFATATVIRDETNWLGKKVALSESNAHFGDEALGSALSAELSHALRTGLTHRSLISNTNVQTPCEIFIETTLPQLQLVCIGAGHIAIALTQLANVVGYRTVVIDPRTAFANAERFPHVAQLIAKWPTEALKEITLSRGTAVAVLTHDPKIDDKALMIALKSNAFYVGALGSKKTHAQRVTRLQESGVSENAIQKMHAPIGLDIGARTPEEIALAVLGEIVRTKNLAQH